MNTSIPTNGQLERTLSQRIQALYRDELGHRTGKITCSLCGSKAVIVIEDSITQPEQILAKEGQTTLAEEVRSELDDAIQPRLKQLIEEVLNVEVIDLLSDATLETGRTGIIAVLKMEPTVRASSATQRLKTRAPL
ncbi:DUF2294 domain-containing protein [Thermocoleostomius sinensis]|jgi:uncharacterized protein YbcI|uniref:DUF2294 domain-containing protein n=1 Tax=Thermocoleostomius sinensis A174 TaxID=2016057 RepID=A0A9E9CBK8_9CYAN|nr:DUF2294 domain-containing protein [Thermocoleostomius sinensis]WAL60725.1 DUF2294 domain-containing protein [Thermocoleostomius sinensis A174]